MRFAIPFTKFEKLADGRMKIVGLASDETLDSQGDILDYDGTKNAASFWRGNIREAHDPKKPVGKALSINFNDEKRTMEVEAFISSGAQDTQAKIAEGVIGSFSVGGGNPTKVRMMQKDGKPVRVVEEWQMTELSVVDAPANPNANFELVKADGVATAILSDELPAAVAEASNRFAKALLDEVQKMKPAKPSPGDAKAVETKKPAPGTAGSNAPARIDVAGDVDDDDAAAGTVGANDNPAVGADTAEIVAGAAAPGTEGPQSSAPPVALVDAEGVPAAEQAPGTGGPASSAPKLSAEAVENTKPAEGTGGADSSAPVPSAETAEEEKVGDEPATSSEGEAPKTAPVSVPKKKLSGKSEGAELKKDMVDGDENDPPDTSIVEAEHICQTCGSVMACQKCMKDEDGMAMALKSMRDEIDGLKKSLEGYTKTTSEDVFKANHGDQLAEGIGKGLSLVNEEIAKANGELKDSIGVEFRAIRESIEALAKTAAVPTPLRSARVAERSPVVGTEQLVKVRTLEAALASVTNPEASAELQRLVAVARMNAGLPV